jgi:replicative DNA helicase
MTTDEDMPPELKALPDMIGPDPHDAAWANRSAPEEAERRCLAMCLRDETRCQVVAALSAEDFGTPSYRAMFEAVIALEATGAPVDLGTVADALEQSGGLKRAGGIDGIADLVDVAWVTDSASVRWNLRRVKREAARRLLFSAGADLADQAKAGEDLDELRATVTDRLAALDEEGDTGPHIVGDVVDPLFAAIEARLEAEDGITGIRSGFSNLDRMTCGWQNGDLVIIAARPSVGKTAFALNLARSAAKDGSPVLFASAEMGRQQITERLLCLIARVDGMNVRAGDLTADQWSDLAGAAGDLKAMPLFIDDTSGATMPQIRARAHQMAGTKDGLGLIVVDYLQLLQSGRKAESQTHETTMISAGLKQLARELEVPVIALSQLNRGVEARKSPEPGLADLRQSGSIEQDADLVGFLWRHDYQDRECEDDEKGKAYLSVKKNRNGPTDRVGFKYFKESSRFEMLDDQA